MDLMTILAGLALLFLLLWDWRDEVKEKEAEHQNRVMRETFPKYPPQHSHSPWDSFWEAVAIVGLLVFVGLVLLALAG